MLQLRCDGKQQVTGAAGCMESVSKTMSASGSPEGWGPCCSGHSGCWQQQYGHRHSPAWQLRCMLSPCHATCSWPVCCTEASDVSRQPVQVQASAAGVDPQRQLSIKASAAFEGLELQAVMHIDAAIWGAWLRAG